MITIHTYSATWDAAMAVKPNIASGTLVRIHQSADAREADSFQRHLGIIEKKAEKFVRSKGKFDIYLIKNEN